MAKAKIQNNLEDLNTSFAMDHHKYSKPTVMYVLINKTLVDKSNKSIMRVFW